ncbi:MAG: UDP-3-O-[3-hydroxymyristoyl] N-acetylglucosamine deacetylase [Oligoflexia bacterium]|nr:UDP-3-O-[3-hydroxymyristoyl] N-acetylglucosamine deacetylase [Oligoflexia bacterium]
MSSQLTLRSAVSLTGESLHSGALARVELRPAAAGTGYVFRHPGQAEAVPAHHAMVVQTLLATTLGCSTWSVATVEHLLAALRGVGLDNVEIVVDGDEIPALDGSAQAWVDLISRAGMVRQNVRRRHLVVRRPVRVQQGDRWASLSPAPHLQVWARIDFDHRDVGRQELGLSLVNGAFVQQLCWARTFGFLTDVEQMRQLGLARGGGLHNAIIYDADGPLNPDGLRAEDELVRHKLLDMLGDLALVGYPVVGRLEAERPGHALTVGLVGKLLSQQDCWDIVEQTGD